MHDSVFGLADQDRIAQAKTLAVTIFARGRAAAVPKFN